MIPTLFGDYNLQTWYEQITQKKFFSSDVALNEIEISNMYLHALKTAPGILRVPSSRCSRGFLEQENQDPQIETILNVLVSKAKETIKNTGLDVLLAGEIGSVHLAEDKSLGEISQEISETIIFLSDFGVDMHTVQDIADWRVFSVTLETIRRITGSPVAPFFPFEATNEGFFPEYERLINKFDIELLGIEVDVHALPELHCLNFDREIPLGLLLSSNKPIENEHSIEAWCSSIKKLSPTVLLGGKNISKNLWLKLRAELRSSHFS